ncbi:hypothetical protein AcW1_002556 [Taiwanofungus camphoratus]|nr:hypothetical protein AcV7_005392 [Antrodia cinnamomea]KAI0943384.1 hypothetical protein AcW1_002556 [Antrodia cinnamomea]
MRPSYFPGDGPAVLDLAVQRPGHDRFNCPKSPQFSETSHSLFHSSYTSEVNHSRWQALRTQTRESSNSSSHLMNYDGLSPLLVPTQDYFDGVFNDPQWTTSPQIRPHPSSSPRHRPAFSRSTPGIVESTPLSPLLPDSGMPSPALPVLSPHASERSRRSTTRKRRRSRLIVPAFMNSRASWLALYFAFNLGLTLYNKVVLVRFPFPYTLTALHALCGSVGGWLLRRRGAYIPAQLTTRNYGALAAFSVLYAINIAVSNVSLELVTVPFHQVVRAATPIFTTVLSVLFFGTQFSRIKILTLVPVMAGVALATYGDYYFTVWGFLLTLLGTFLAALKTIYTNVLQSSPPPDSTAKAVTHPSTGIFLQPSHILPPRLSLHPLDLLTRISPLACVLCLLYACYSGELGRARHSFAQSEGIGGTRVLILLGNGAIAFGLNVVSLSANKHVGALNMTVAANVKQALTILCAVALFHLTITPMNALGIVITLAGGAWYAWVEYLDKMAKRAQTKRVLTSAGSS